TAEHFLMLFENADSIASTPYEEFVEGFNKWAEEVPPHSSEAWQDLFKITVLPFHKRLKRSPRRWAAVHQELKRFIEEDPNASLQEWRSYYRANVKPNMERLEATMAAAEKGQNSSHATNGQLQEIVGNKPKENGSRINGSQEPQS